MAEESSDFKRRRFCVEKRIASLSSSDYRVAVIGTVLNIDSESLIFSIEDPSGQLTIISPIKEMIAKLSPGFIVRVIGTVLPYDEGVELRAEVVQDFSKLSPELFPVIHNLML